MPIIFISGLPGGCLENSSYLIDRQDQGVSAMEKDAQGSGEVGSMEHLDAWDAQGRLLRG